MSVTENNVIGGFLGFPLIDGKHLLVSLSVFYPVTPIISNLISALPMNCIINFDYIAIHFWNL